MKNLTKYTHGKLKVNLEDYFGEKHTGEIILKKSENRKTTENHYFFIREDGAKIQIYHNGTLRIVEQSPGNLKLAIRGIGGMYITPELLNSREEAINSLKFENMRVY